jgi:hypothetical protein
MPNAGTWTTPSEKCNFISLILNNQISAGSFVVVKSRTYENNQIFETEKLLLVGDVGMLDTDCIYEEDEVVCYANDMAPFVDVLKETIVELKPKTPVPEVE